MILKIVAWWVWVSWQYLGGVIIAFRQHVAMVIEVADVLSPLRFRITVCIKKISVPFMPLDPLILVPYASVQQKS